MKEHKPHSELRAKIVAALNLTPLVPPQADTETLNVVEDAWAALSELMRSVEQLQTAERERDEANEAGRLINLGWNDAMEAKRNLCEQLRNAEDRVNASNRVREKWEAKHAGLLEQFGTLHALLTEITGREVNGLWSDQDLVDRVRAALNPANSPRCYCGDLTWTERHHGRVTHKHACPARMDEWCQTHPEGGCDPVAARAALEKTVQSPASRQEDA